MKKMVILTIIVILLLPLTVYEQPYNDNAIVHDNSPTGEKLVEYSTFERALLLATDVVSAKYVTHRNFGRTLIEFEFRVVDRIFGNAADKIFVYAERSYASMMGSEELTIYNESDIKFNTKTTYLLPITRINSGALGKTHEDGYLFIRNLVIDLDNPTLSTMYNESLSMHSSELDFNSSDLKANQIVTFITERTKNNALAREHIRSDKLKDIINGSPYVWIVEINDPIRLSGKDSDWAETDVYNCTVIYTLKGDVEEKLDYWITFLADTVTTGEQHIVAVERVETGSNMFRITSKNSLFRMDQLDEIMKIIEQDEQPDT